MKIKHKLDINKDFSKTTNVGQLVYHGDVLLKRVLSTKGNCSGCYFRTNGFDCIPNNSVSCYLCGIPNSIFIEYEDKS